MSECVLWQGLVGNHGYGLTGGKLVHRVAWAEANGEIPPGMHIHHYKEEQAWASVT